MSARSSNRNILGLALTLGCVLACVVLVGAWTLHVSTNDCERVSKLELVIQQQGRRTLKTLGQPGGIGYNYYRLHPDELVQARRQLHQQITDFTPAACSGIF